MQNKEDGYCYLCARLHYDIGRKQTQEHHVIFGTANRRLSERYGLKVYLCPEHHVYGKEAVHKNTEIDKAVKEEAQKAFKRRYPELSFIDIFGKNYIAEET